MDPQNPSLIIKAPILLPSTASQFPASLWLKQLRSWKPGAWQFPRRCRQPS